MTTFDAFFRDATGHEPYGYQARIARDGLPDMVRAATGTGKTGVILAWLWRRLHGPDPEATPRRLIYALPQRSLVEHVAGAARAWLGNLGLDDEVALHVVMGGRGESLGDWRENMHRPAIIVGTAGSLVSKALNRGYGISRAMYPIDFALVTNGAHWVIDEVQLCPGPASTLRQVAAFAKRCGTAEPFGLTCLSAAVPGGPGETAGSPPGGILTEILPGERTGQLAVRLGAARTFRRLPAAPGDYRAIAAAARERHRPGTLTLVVLNTADAACAVGKHLRGGGAPAGAEVTLLHSRFRGIERAGLMAAVAGSPDNRIVVATQVAEAGTDLSAATLISEASPWPSLVQRAGRCNREGLRNADAGLWWVPPAKPAPYEQPDIDATVAELEQLEGECVTGEALLARDVFTAPHRAAVIRHGDFTGLFDTSPGLGGDDVDITPYAGDLDAEVAWATWTPAEGGAPAPDIKAPPAEYRCRVPLGDIAALASGRAAWRLDQVAGEWRRVGASGPNRARPGEVLLVSAADGGYDPETGFDLSAGGPVAGSPALRTTAELAELPAGTEAAGGAGAGQRAWQTLDQHSAQVRDQAAALLAAASPVIPNAPVLSAVAAGYLHDVGKAHPTWQDALCALAAEEERDQITAGRPWAKSDGRGGALNFAGGVAFRHELASLLLLDGPLRPLLAQAPDEDLCRYLVLAHHGQLRMQVRDPGRPHESGLARHAILGLEQGATSDIPPMLGQPPARLVVDLGQFGSGDGGQWRRTVAGLLGRYGPFILAYLETLVRIADWRASGRAELP